MMSQDQCNAKQLQRFVVYSPSARMMASLFIIPMESLYSVFRSLVRIDKSWSPMISFVKFVETDIIKHGSPFVVSLQDHQYFSGHGEQIIIHMLKGKYDYRVYCAMCDATYESRFIVGKWWGQGRGAEYSYKCPSMHRLFEMPGPVE